MLIFGTLFMTISNYSANSGEALYFDEFQQISGTQPDSPKEIGIVSPNFAGQLNSYDDHRQKILISKFQISSEQFDICILLPL